MSVSIEPMTIDDYDEAVTLWDRCDGVGLSEGDDRQSLGRYLDRNHRLSQVARTDVGKLVGAVMAGHDGRRGFLHHLAVDPDWRGRGIGRQLVHRCVEGLRRDGIGRCHLMLFRDNEPARRFWEKLGWRQREDLNILSAALERGDGEMKRGARSC